MTRNQQIYVGVTAAVVTLNIVRYVKFRQDQKKIRAQIIADCDAQVEAIFAAGKTVNRRIKEGDYDGKNIGDIMSDFEFEIIANRFEK